MGFLGKNLKYVALKNWSSEIGKGKRTWSTDYELKSTSDKFSRRLQVRQEQEGEE